MQSDKRKGTTEPRILRRKYLAEDGIDLQIESTITASTFSVDSEAFSVSRMTNLKILNIEVRRFKNEYRNTEMLMFV